MRALFRKPKEADGINLEGRADAVIYSLQTTEGQTRLAADICFLLREYE